MTRNNVVVFEGYFCHSRDEDESYGYEYLLCKLVPEVIPPQEWGYGGDRIVPPETCEMDDIVGECEIFSNMKLGKRYRITIERLTDGSEAMSE